MKKKTIWVYTYCSPDIYEKVENLPKDYSFEIALSDAFEKLLKEKVNVQWRENGKAK